MRPHGKKFRRGSRSKPSRPAGVWPNLSISSSKDLTLRTQAFGLFPRTE